MIFFSLQAIFKNNFRNILDLPHDGRSKNYSAIQHGNIHAYSLLAVAKPSR